MNVRDKKGSITLFVLVGLLFMSGFLIISFGNLVNKSKISREQMDIISDIYSHKDGDANAYERAYTALRKKNAKSLAASVEEKANIELTKTFEGKLSNYKIYGNTSAVGEYDSISGKYKIDIKTTDEENNSQVYNIYIEEPLKKSGTLVDYIDFKSKKVIRIDGTEKYIDLPEISTYEDYTKIEILTEVEPSKIELEYIGYEFRS